MVPQGHWRREHCFPEGNPPDDLFGGVGRVRLTVRVRSSNTQRTGILGIEAVEKALSALNWAPLNTSKFDIGTDLVLMARDARMFDLGLYVGAQVKSGSSHFKKPAKDGGEITGWWWYDPNPEKHLNVWASFPLPQLLILPDVDRDESYWVHVTPDRVRSTGKGAKILVPTSNTIDEEHFDELIAIAGSVRGKVDLEGALGPRDEPFQPLTSSGMRSLFRQLITRRGPLASRGVASCRRDGSFERRGCCARRRAGPTQSDGRRPWRPGRERRVGCARCPRGTDGRR
jgi:hypothetical protein